MPNRLAFLGIDVAVTTKAALLKAVEEGQKIRIATLNPEFMLEARSNGHFREALKDMTHCTIDGTGLHWVLSLKGIKTEKYPGSDFFEDTVTRYCDGSKSFFLLGGMPGVAATARETLEKRFPSIRIVGATDGGMINPADPLTKSLKKELSEIKPDILFVGFGAPKQELWIHAAKSLPIQVMAGIGGSFGFYGLKHRAPLWMRKLRLEWLYRAFTEKGHLRRVLRAVIVFPLWALTRK